MPVSISPGAMHPDAMHPDAMHPDAMQLTRTSGAKTSEQPRTKPITAAFDAL
jgi:hypothetical protein